MERAHTEMNWHTSILPPATVRALDFFSKAQWLANSGWYLAGGTALALHVGHRNSEDLDFFTPEKNFPANKVLGLLPESSWETTRAEDGTIYGTYMGAKVSFISLPFFLPKDEKLHYGTISVLSPRDIAVMKIIATSQRGKKRDFIDLYWYALNREPLEQVIRRLPAQYPNIAHNYHHIIKSLIYFEDAENDPMPKLHFQADWKEVKEYFRREVPQIAKDLLGLPDTV